MEEEKRAKNIALWRAAGKHVSNTRSKIFLPLPLCAHVTFSTRLFKRNQVKKKKEEKSLVGNLEIFVTNVVRFLVAGRNIEETERDHRTDPALSVSGASAASGDRC